MTFQSHKMLSIRDTEFSFQRDRKERKFYTDDIIGDADDEIEGPQSFNLEEKLETSRFNKPVVKELKGSGLLKIFNLSYF